MIKISKKILRAVGRTNAEFNMIKDGDRILLGASGGKDSTLLANVLNHIKRHAPFKFEFKALSVHYGIGEDFSFLKEHFRDEGIEYEIYHSNILEVIEKNVRQNSSYCSFCARMRRGALYSRALELGYNKVALGHHLDDAVESFFMNLFYNGTLRSMPPSYRAYNGLFVIRPLIKVRERQIIDFANSEGIITPQSCNCPAKLSENKKPFVRENMKEFLKDLETNHENLFKSFSSSFSNIHASTFFDKRFYEENLYRDEFKE